MLYTTMQQTPSADTPHLKWAGDLFEVTLRLDRPRPGRAVFRTNLGMARVRRRELIASTESGEPVLARDWHDIPMREEAPGVFRVRVPLTEVGIFEGKACFFAEGSSVPEWPAGDNLRIKVGPAHTACANTMYTAFVRQFGAARHRNPSTPELREHEAALDRQGYTVIPPSGTFRDLIRQLDTIMGRQRFRILQLLPVHPVPTTYARMGRYGSAFAALDFFSVDPALAEFDTYATPLDQFRELIDAVHSRGGSLFMDLPANHTGWAATLHTHHPDWFRRRPDGEFISPGAWGVTWADLVELDYSDPRLRAYMAKVFLFWCSQGVDGFRCDAGYMIPVETWTYIVARVRKEFPDTIFMLEGLGGKVEVTEELLTVANLDWAYSELFQTEDRGAFDWYLPRAIPLAERCGPLIHFAETHDNNRLAARGECYARMRVALSALLSHQGAFGITAGVEWFATEKVDVHGASALNWDAPHNQVAEIARLNALLETHPAFGPDTRLRPVQRGDGPFLAVLRDIGTDAATDGSALLVLVNLDCAHPQTAHWDEAAFHGTKAWDLVTGEAFALTPGAGLALAPGRACCLTLCAEDVAAVDAAAAAVVEPAALSRRRRNLMALRVKLHLAAVDNGDDDERFACTCEPDELGAAMTADPDAFCADAPNQLPRRTVWYWPEDQRRQVMLPEGHVLLARADTPFRAELKSGRYTQARERAVRLDDSTWGAFLIVPPYDAALDGTRAEQRSLVMTVFTDEGVQRAVSDLLVLPPAGAARAVSRVSGVRVRNEPDFCTVLSNSAGAMAQARAAWGEVRSQYDCLLAVNPDPRVPADKMIFWTRCRTWLRYRGYSHAIEAACLDAFTTDPAGRFAEWCFKVPCGIGRWVPLRFRLELEPGVNRARLRVSRPAVGACGLDAAQAGLLEADEPVKVIVRPDIEWRSFHHKTKAFMGPEHEWPAAVHPLARGFTFEPTDGMRLGIEATAGAFHIEPSWAYMVAHPEEQERGLDGHSDLFSPGWFDLLLDDGGEITLKAGDNSQSAIRNPQSATFNAQHATPTGALATIPETLSQALSLYVVRRDALKTVIAGYPWFLDWGRDTLIVLRGLIADGRHDDALEILREFGRFEERGTLPNIIHGNTVGNRDTSDAPLWFCVAAGDLMEAMGDRKVLDVACGSRTLREVLVSILTYYRDGTPNGIHMDPASGLIYSPSHFTWMDTNYPAATPREGYPVEIQALWIASLQLVARKIDAEWNALAERATSALARLYVVKEGWLADCLRAKAGEPAERALQEDTLRPNQLLALTLGVPLAPELARTMISACERLLVPGAIRSLADRPVLADCAVWHNGTLLNDPHRPYQGRYLGDEDTRRKPAYHNGTAWSWPFPLYVEALVQLYGDSARATGLSLLGSAIEQLNRGCLGHPPEICDGDAPHAARGCCAQAWGVSELLRVWLRITRGGKSPAVPCKPGSCRG